jgi:hypothetical protein
MWRCCERVEVCTSGVEEIQGKLRNWRPQRGNRITEAKTRWRGTRSHRLVFLLSALFLVWSVVVSLILSKSRITHLMILLLVTDASEGSPVIVSFRSPSLCYLPVHSRCRGCLFSLDHTQTHTTISMTHLEEGSARRRDLYLTTQTLYKRQTSTPPGEIRTRNPSKRSAADLRLRPRGHWDRPMIVGNEKACGRAMPVHTHVVCQPAQSDWHCEDCHFQHSHEQTSSQV